MTMLFAQYGLTREVVNALYSLCKITRLEMMAETRYPMTVLKDVLIIDAIK